MEIRGYREGDEEPIIELLGEVFDGWPHIDLDCSSLDHWNWKFSHDLSKKTMALAVDGDKIVGTFLTTFCNLKIGDSTYLTSNGVDVAVQPNYRGLGLFNKTRSYTGKQRAKHDVKCHLGRSSNPIVSEKYERNFQGNPRLWPKAPFTINWMARIRDTSEYVKKNPTDYATIKMLGYKALSNTYKLESKIARRPKIRGKFELRQAKSFDGSTDAFYDAIKNSYNFIIERKQEYMNWRYIDPRAGKFRVIFAEENSNVVGYSVLKVNRYHSGNARGEIADILAAPGRLDIVDALLSEAVHYLDESNINMQLCYIFENHPYQKIYNNYGFVTTNNEWYYLWLTEDLGKPINDIQNTPVKKAHTSYGDEDA